MGELAGLGASYVGEIEKEIVGAAESGDESVSAPNDGAPPTIRLLTGGVEAAPPRVEPAGPSKNFGAQKDDFYPTELHPGHER